MTTLLINFVYFVSFLIISPWCIFKMFTSGKYRAGIAQRMGFINLKDSKEKCIWFHGVSNGEVLCFKKVLEQVFHPKIMIPYQVMNLNIIISKVH